MQGSKCLHKVTECSGDKDRLVAVLTFFTKPGRKNSPAVQKMFWGRSSDDVDEEQAASPAA